MNIIPKLIFLFTIVPLIELWFLIRLSYSLGNITTVSIVACTGIIGAVVTKKQSLSVLKEINSSLAQGQIPADKLIDGLLILIGGVMLITPGVITDLCGFSCVLPWTRPKIKYFTKGKFKKLITSGQIHFFAADSEDKDKSDQQ
ncbi:MAG: FxsA family protein [Bacillota bacterium]